MKRCAQYFFCCLLGTFNLLQAQDGPKPATIAEIKNAIEWTKVPKMPGATKISTQLSFSSYDAPGTFLEAAEFYRKNLPALGWVEDTTPIPGIDQKSYLYAVFDKGGIRLNISGYRAKPDGPMTITLTNSGNVDLRTYPRPAGVKVKSDYRTAVIFTTDMKPSEVADYCKKELKAKGWKEGHDDSAEFHAKEGRTILRFLCNAMEITVVIYKNKEGQTETTYTVSVSHEMKQDDVAEAITGKKIATPATYQEVVALLDLTKLPRMEKAEKLRLRQTDKALPFADGYQCPAGVDDVAKYYRKQFAALGFTELSPEIEIDYMVQLKFEKAGYLISVSAQRNDKAKITEVNLINYGNVDLRQLPFPAGANIRLIRTQTMNCTTTLTNEEAFEFYRKELPKLGWKEVKSRGQGTMRFVQNDCELRLEIGSDSNNRTGIKVSTGIALSAE